MGARRAGRGAGGRRVRQRPRAGWGGRWWGGEERAAHRLPDLGLEQQPRILGVADGRAGRLQVLGQAYAGRPWAVVCLESLRKLRAILGRGRADVRGAAPAAEAGRLCARSGRAAGQRAILRSLEPGAQRSAAVPTAPGRSPRAPTRTGAAVGAADRGARSPAALIPGCRRAGWTPSPAARPGCARAGARRGRSRAHACQPRDRPERGAARRRCGGERRSAGPPTHARAAGTRQPRLAALAPARNSSTKTNSQRRKRKRGKVPPPGGRRCLRGCRRARPRCRPRG